MYHDQVDSSGDIPTYIDNDDRENDDLQKEKHKERDRDSEMTEENLNC